MQRKNRLDISYNLYLRKQGYRSKSHLKREDQKSHGSDVHHLSQESNCLLSYFLNSKAFLANQPCYVSIFVLLFICCLSIFLSISRPISHFDFIRDSQVKNLIGIRCKWHFAMFAGT